MSIPLGRIRLDGEKLDARVEANVAGGELLRSMDGASTLTLEIHDPGRDLLLSGVLARRSVRVEQLAQAAWTRLGKVRLSLDGAFFRLAGFEKNGSMINLTFEDEIVALLRAHSRHLKQSREDTTRAQFIRRIVSIPEEVKILKHLPSIDKRQKIADPEIEDTGAGRQGIRANAKILIKGVQADREQIRLLNTALGVAIEENAGERATLALIMALIQESTVRNLTGGHSSSVGPLQLLNIHLRGSTSTRGGRRDVELVVRMFLTDGFTGNGGAIQIAREPGYKPEQIAATVQGNAAGAPDYAPHREEAEAILDAYGGTGGTVSIREQFDFEAGIETEDENGRPQREDYWQSIERLAAEVNWRAFTANNVFIYASDDDLLRGKPRIAVAEQPTARQRERGVQYVGNIDIPGWHYNKPVGECRFTIAADRWLAHPGAVAEVLRLGPCDGRWLIKELRQGVRSSELDVTLTRPSPAKPEPAPNIRTIAEQDPETGGVARERIVKAARKALAEAAKYQYEMTRPYPGSLYSPAPRRLDCSSFVTLVYKAARVPDPNGLGYNGNGYTGTLWAHGTRTNNPQPGDLAFYGTPQAAGGNAHVNVYIGRENGVEMSINMGGAGVTKLATRSVRGDFVAFKSFDLTDT